MKVIKVSYYDIISITEVKSFILLCSYFLNISMLDTKSSTQHVYFQISIKIALQFFKKKLFRIFKEHKLMNLYLQFCTSKLSSEIRQWLLQVTITLCIYLGSLGVVTIYRKKNYLLSSHKHRHLRKIDWLMEITACLVCLICTVSGCSKKCKNALVRCGASSGHITKLEQSIFFWYLCAYPKEPR